MVNLQYIADSDGKTTGVFIPISDWNALKKKFKGIEEIEVPEWHENIINERLEEYKKKPNQALDFDNTIDEIEKHL